MPYSDPEEQKDAQADWYRQKYQTDPDFRNDEADRKAQWYEANAEERKAKMRDYARKRRAAAKKKKGTR